jgi:hypothetical protein
MKLSRRKYAELVKFLKSVMGNPKVGLRVRMAAAMRLDEIYSRHEAAEQKRLDREARILAAQTDKEDRAPTDEPSPAPDVSDEIKDIWHSILEKPNAAD